MRVDRWADGAFSAEELEDPALDPRALVSIRALKSALKRRRRVWLTIGFAGLLIGAALHVVLPSKVTAVSKLYVVEPATDPTTAITNDLSLLQTRKVAATAMGILGLDPNGSLITYKGAAEGSSIVEIKVTGPSAAQAKTWNNAVAKAFLQVRGEFLSESTKTEVATLQAEMQSLQTDIQQLSADSSNKAGNLAGLDKAQFNTLQLQALQAEGQQAAANKYSVVLDPAYVTAASIKKTAIKDGLAGLVAGLALGMGIVLIGELLSDRVRTRADVASALGAPVDLSVGRFS